MWQKSAVLILLFLAPTFALAADPIPLIFDTDMGNDIDDALALATIHAFETRGECRLIGVTLTKDDPLAAPFVDMINTYYGRGTVPIGVVKNGKGRKGSSYLQVASRKKADGSPLWPHDLREASQVEDAVVLLRRLLAQVPNQSAVIVQVGFSTNLAAFLDSKGDSVSPLSGLELAREKVVLLSIMAGNFDKQVPEFNVREDVPAAQKLLTEWPTEVVLSGWEIGAAVPYPAVSIEQDFRASAGSPVVDAYKAYAKMPYDRPTWDLTSVLYAVRPTRDYFGLSEPGLVLVDDKGVTVFEKKPGGRHRYLTLTAEKKAKTLEALVQLSSQPACLK